MVDWSIGQLIVWSVGGLADDWLICWLVDWLIGWLIDWLIDWFVEWLIYWLIGGLSNIVDVKGMVKMKTIMEWIKYER